MAQNELAAPTCSASYKILPCSLDISTFITATSRVGRLPSRNSRVSPSCTSTLASKRGERMSASRRSAAAPTADSCQRLQVQHGRRTPLYAAAATHHN